MYTKFVRKGKRRKPLRRLDHKWDDNIKINLEVVGMDCLETVSNSGLLWTQL
jgi:hypothetical protein